MHVHNGVTQTDLVAIHTARYATRGMPSPTQPAVQVNVCTGPFPLRLKVAMPLHQRPSMRSCAVLRRQKVCGK